MNRDPLQFPVDPGILFRHELGLNAPWGIDYLAVLDCEALVLGIGGFGTHVAIALARMGVRKLVLVDRDTVSWSNVPRHVLFSLSDVGLPKATVAAAALEAHRVRSEIEVHDFDVTLKRSRLADLIERSDFVFTLFDSRAPTILAGWLCRHFEKPMVSGGVDSTSGFTFMYRYQAPRGRPCEECYARSAVLGPPTWTAFYVTLQAREMAGTAMEEFDRRSSSPPSSPIVYTSACMGAQEMVNVFLRQRMRISQPSQVRINAMNHRMLVSREPGREDCVVCGDNRVLCKRTEGPTGSKKVT